MFVEAINTNPQLGLPDPASKIWDHRSSPAYVSKDAGTGTTAVGLAAGEKRVVPLTMHTPYVNDDGVLSLQASAAVTVKVTTLPLSEVQAAAAAVAAGGPAPTAMWAPVTVAANSVVTLPTNVTGVYLEAAGAAYVVIRRT